jgi:hypothetical protein
MSPASCARKWIVLTGLICAPLTAIQSHAASLPQGGEYPISGELAGDQTAPSVAIGSAGGWVVWQDNGSDRKGLGIVARHLDNLLTPSGSAIRVNRIVNGDQEKPSVALLSDGGAVMTWQGGVSGFQNIYARFLRPDGSFATDDILVSQPSLSKTIRITTNMTVYRNSQLRQRTLRMKESVKIRQERTANSSVVSLNGDTVVVVYTSARQVNRNSPVIEDQVREVHGHFLVNSVVTYVPTAEDSWQDIYFQRFTAAGEKIGAEVRANNFTTFNQRSPSVAALSDGSFVVVWISEQQRGENSIDVMARRFGNDGAPLGPELMVNTSDRLCASPSVAGSASGGFTVSWTQRDAVRQNSLDIYARAFNSSGSPITGAVLVNSHQYGDQHTPRVASAPGGQIVVWTSLAQDGSKEGVYGRWLNDGAVAGDEFRVNTTTLLRQFMPAVAADSDNRALVIWSSYQTLAGFDLFGQRYTAP